MSTGKKNQAERWQKIYTEHLRCSAQNIEPFSTSKKFNLKKQVLNIILNTRQRQENRVVHTLANAGISKKKYHQVFT
jgi:hypothetical protein